MYKIFALGSGNIVYGKGIFRTVFPCKGGIKNLDVCLLKFYMEIYVGKIQISHLFLRDGKYRFEGDVVGWFFSGAIKNDLRRTKSVFKEI